MPQAAARRPPPLPVRLADTVLEELWFADDDPARTHDQASRSLALEIARLKGLKPFPAVARRVMSMATNPDVRVSDIRRALEADPALSARTLQVANSALFSIGKPCQTVDQAIVRVGTRAVHDLMATVAVLGMFADVREAGKLIRDHSVGVAAIAKALVRQNGWYAGGQVFVAGMLHDIGKLLLMQTEEMRYDNLSLEHAEVDRVQILERRRLGYDHAVLGAHAIEAWQIGEPIAKVVAYHHQPGRAYAEGGDVGLMVAIVRLADRIERRVATSEVPPAPGEHWFGDEATTEYLGISVEDLTRAFPEFVAARTDVLSAFA